MTAAARHYAAAAELDRMWRQPNVRPAGRLSLARAAAAHVMIGDRLYKSQRAYLRGRSQAANARYGKALKDIQRSRARHRAIEEEIAYHRTGTPMTVRNPPPPPPLGYRGKRLPTTMRYIPRRKKGKH